MGRAANWPTVATVVAVAWASSTLSCAAWHHPRHVRNTATWSSSASPASVVPTTPTRCLERTAGLCRAAAAAADDALVSFLESDVGLDAAAVLEACPKIVERDVHSQLRPTLAFLFSLYGDEFTLSALKNSPHLLCIDVAETTTPATDFLKELGVTKATLKRVKQNQRGLLLLDVAAVLEPVVAFLRGLLDDDPAALVKVISRFPQVLSLSVADQLEPLVVALRALGISDSSLARLVVRHPQILGYSVPNKVEPMLAYWSQIGVGRTGRVVETAPSLLGMSLDANLKPKIEFFEALGMAAHKMIEAHPTTFTLSLESNLKPKVEYLLGALPNAHVEMQRNPSVLDMNLDTNIKPTVDYLSSLGYEAEHLRARHLAASLSGRIIPRRQYLNQHGHASLRPNLNQLTTSSDVSFCEAFSIDVEHFREFRQISKFQQDFHRWVQTGQPIGQIRAPPPSLPASSALHR